MPINTNENPTGKIDLVDYFDESPSGHDEESKKISLMPDQGTQVKMTVFTHSWNQFDGPKKENTECWVIERDALIDLIKKHGRRK